MLKSLLMVALIGSSHAETVALRPIADTTLFELNPTHNLGGHTDVSVGGIAKTKAAGGAYAARGLFRFAITNIPLGSAISSVALTLTVSRAPGSGGVGSVFDLRRVLKPWGEGDKTGNMGLEASPLEATWNSRFASAEGWETPGGAVGSDFAGSPSASLSIDDLGNYTFASTSNLVADVQAWVANPETNFGWVLMSQSENTSQTARRFGSREDTNSAPTLVLDYSGPAQELRITSFAITNQEVSIAWTGGSPPYQLQQKLGLIGADWTNAGEPTMINDAILSVAANQSFFRIAQVVTPPAVLNNARSEPVILQRHDLASDLLNWLPQPRR